MARSRKTERRYLSEEEVKLLDKTHFPELRLIDSPDLLKLRKKLREIRDGAAGGAGLRQQRQPGAARGGVAQPGAGMAPKAGDSGAARPEPAEGAGSKMRRDILSAAVKRVNREIERRRTGAVESRQEDNTAIGNHV
ncbi:hypothetical protein [Rhodoligotrophos defluvii]|uniref:hypothetical protein n=1 Tax=Rhodoligotrophos defluvii TaxID=2561934 RepID=UPI0010C93C23|nr:hypothetical protein [Rhodoligotrophos defluvii]